MTTAAFVALGLLFGILVNGLADHLPQRAHSVWPACHYCAQPYAPGRLSSIGAYLTGRGSCSHCEAPVRVRNVLVELGAIGILLYLVTRFGLTLEFALLALLLQAFLLITVIDLERRLIPFSVVIPAALVAALYALFGARLSWQRVLIGGASGYFSMYLVFVFGGLFGRIAARLRKQPLDEVAFGGGDVNLAGVIGLAVGWPGVVLALLIGVTAGGIAAFFILLGGVVLRRYQAFRAIPYGPFLVLGAVAVLVFGPEIQAWYFGR